MGDNGWFGIVEEYVFEVGGVKRIVFGLEGEVFYIEEFCYLDIVLGFYIINLECILKSSMLIFVLIIFFEFLKYDEGCKLIVMDKFILLNE